MANFFAKDLELKYAMPVTRSKNTNQVINAPEVLFRLRDDFILISVHRHLFKLLKVINPDSEFNFSDYLKIKNGSDPETHESNLSVMIQDHLENFPNSFIDTVMLNKSQVTYVPASTSLKKDLNYWDWDKSAYENQIGKVVNFSKNNHIIEVIVKNTASIITHRYCDEDGFTLQLQQPRIVNQHINKLDLNKELNSPAAQQNARLCRESLRDNKPRKFSDLATLSFNDRNLLEEERLRMFLMIQ
tara:strand:+ start:647 stop:1378 length:732 start_codon:yes stop_codon:yes gene_type:complete